MLWTGPADQVPPACLAALPFFCEPGVSLTRNRYACSQLPP